MPISIGIFTARQSLENIRTVDQEMRRRCTVTYFPYGSMAELGKLYEKNSRKFDGILFSGPIPREYVQENIGPIPKPSRCIDLENRDFYLAAARLFAANPGLDFSRVYFDTIVDPAVFRNIFDYGNYPPHSPIGHTPLEHRRFLRSPIYERSMDIYRALWKEKVFDILVTRFTNLAEQLEKEGIPHVLLMPSAETILEHFHALLADIKESMLQNSLVACCIVKVPAENQSQETYDRLRKALDAFSMKHSQNILIRKNGPCFEVTTSSMEVKSLTQNYTQCLLSSELHRALPFPPELGWGIGFDIVAAYKNAKRALAECSRDKHHYTYLVTESQEMVGPLNSNRSISYGLQPDAHVFSLAKSLGIAAVNLEKLMSLQKTRNMYEFTSGDLVYFLEITPRSAARILLKLADGGLARPVRAVNLNGAGRPSTVYEIDFSPFLS